MIYSAILENENVTVINSVGNVDSVTSTEQNILANDAAISNVDANQSTQESNIEMLSKFNLF